MDQPTAVRPRLPKPFFAGIDTWRSTLRYQWLFQWKPAIWMFLYFIVGKEILDDIRSCCWPFRYTTISPLILLLQFWFYLLSNFISFQFNALMIVNLSLGNRISNIFKYVVHEMYGWQMRKCYTIIIDNNLKVLWSGGR